MTNRQPLLQPLSEAEGWRTACSSLDVATAQQGGTALAWVSHSLHQGASCHRTLAGAGQTRPQASRCNRHLCQTLQLPQLRWMPQGFPRPARPLPGLPPQGLRQLPQGGWWWDPGQEGRQLLGPRPLPRAPAQPLGGTERDAARRPSAGPAGERAVGPADPGSGLGSWTGGAGGA